MHGRYLSATGFVDCTKWHLSAQLLLSRALCLPMPATGHNQRHVRRHAAVHQHVPADWRRVQQGRHADAHGTALGHVCSAAAGRRHHVRPCNLGVSTRPCKQALSLGIELMCCLHAIDAHWVASAHKGACAQYKVHWTYTLQSTSLGSY